MLVFRGGLPQRGSRAKGDQWLVLALRRVDIVSYDDLLALASFSGTTEDGQKAEESRRLNFAVRRSSPKSPQALFG
jgi:hypothetical protein